MHFVENVEAFDIESKADEEEKGASIKQPGTARFLHWLI